MTNLPLATRSLLFATLGGVAVPVIVVLESADAAALAARSEAVLDELLPLLGAYYAAHIAEQPAGGVAASGARAETLAGATIAARFALRERAMGLFTSVARDGGFRSVHGASYEIHATLADRAGGAARTAAALAV